MPERYHTSHTLTLDCCDAVDKSTPDVLSIETVDTSCVATVGSLGVVTLGGLLSPAASTWSVGSFAVISGDSSVCHNTLIVCHSYFLYWVIPACMELITLSMLFNLWRTVHTDTQCCTLNLLQCLLFWLLCKVTWSSS